MCKSDSFKDFISKCLEWDPEKRITPFDALMHEWIIEGLPPEVLIHHKKMLGIYDSETDDDQMLQNDQSRSLANDNGSQVMQNQSQSQSIGTRNSTERENKQPKQ